MSNSINDVQSLSHSSMCGAFCLAWGAPEASQAHAVLAEVRALARAEAIPPILQGRRDQELELSPFVQVVNRTRIPSNLLPTVYIWSSCSRGGWARPPTATDR